MNIFILILLILIFKPAATADCSSEDQGDVSFDTPSLKGKKCKNLDRDYCIFTGETKAKCPCNCKKFIYGDQSNAGQKPEQQPSEAKGKGGKGRRFCFHADDKVVTRDGQLLTMQQLVHSPNVRILTGEDYSTVRYWLHAETETRAEFLVVTTTSGHQLRISSEHLIYRSITCLSDRQDTVFAKRLKPGHCLRVYDDKTEEYILTPVANISAKVTRGIYAPITETGSIVVNGILASCYTNYEDEAVQKMIYSVLLGVKDFMDHWKPLKVMSNFLFGDRTSSVAPIPMFVYTLLDLSPYFVHAH